MNDLFSLSGKTALISGGSRGIGLEIAKAFLNAKAKVIITSRHQEDIDAVIKMIDDKDLSGYVCDVSSEKDIKDLINTIKDESCPDILVNNAGINIKQALHQLENDNYEKVFRTNIEGPLKLCREVLPFMMEKRQGKIINICSMMSEYGSEFNTAYAVSKGALKLLTRNIAAEYGKYNIQCNGIGPGYIYTELNRKMRIPKDDGSLNDFETYINSRIPAGHWGDVKDIAGPAVFLASGASDYVNGHILYVDGGFSIAIGGPSGI